GALLPGDNFATHPRSTSKSFLRRDHKLFGHPPNSASGQNDRERSLQATFLGLMEAFPRLNDGFITPSPSSTPTSTRKTSRASSSSPGRTKPSLPPSSLTPASPITQPATRNKQNSELLIVP
ncbi:7783_t:CDS:2, partial [Acaulospora colombiana]